MYLIFITRVGLVRQPQISPPNIEQPDRLRGKKPCPCPAFASRRGQDGALPPENDQSSKIAFPNFHSLPGPNKGVNREAIGYVIELWRFWRRNRRGRPDQLVRKPGLTKPARLPAVAHSDGGDAGQMVESANVQRIVIKPPPGACWHSWPTSLPSSYRLRGGA